MRTWIALICLLSLAGCERGPEEPETLQISDTLGGESLSGFARAEQPRQFQFPQDHGPHPEYRNEWWYLTGNLTAESGEAFGFQVTFFRIGLKPGERESPSAWRSRQIWMGHAALSRIDAGEHLADERFAREALELAGAQADPPNIWLEDWRLSQELGSGLWRLDAPAEGFHLLLTLQSLSPIVLQGDRGLSQKSSESGNASYYYSIPRMQATGELSYRGEEYQVTGLTWLDREWSTSALGEHQEGWDWFSLQLDDQRNLMYYQIRNKGGAVDPHSAGSISGPQGRIRGLEREQVKLTPLRYWSSGDRRYPIEWRLKLEGEAHAWRIKPRIDDQEMRLSVRYWEGAVEVFDEVTSEPLGKGYLELAGY